MYIPRLYCKKRDKGYINNYETIETQVITVSHTDNVPIQFKVYGTCTDISSIYINYGFSANSQSANTNGEFNSTSVIYKILQGDTIITQGSVSIGIGNIFTIPINALSSGYYELSVSFTIDTYTYTRLFPLISS